MSEKTTGTSIFTSIAAGGFGVISLQEWLAILSAVAVVITTVVNWYYRHKNYQLALKDQKRKEAEDAKRLRTDQQSY